MDEDEFYENDRAAAYLGQSPTTTVTWRHRKQGPAYIKIGRKVVYRKSALDAFIEAATVDPSAHKKQGTA